MKLILRLKGGPGSGHRGHAGRPGQRGGSVSGAGISKREVKFDERDLSTWGGVGWDTVKDEKTGKSGYRSRQGDYEARIWEMEKGKYGLRIMRFYGATDKGDWRIDSSYEGKLKSLVKKANSTLETVKRIGEFHKG